MKIATYLKTGDKVQVTAGKDLGKLGEVEQIILAKGRVLVKGINQVKKHVKAKARNQQGGIVTINRPIAISNIMLVCPSCNKRTRISINGQGKDKQRICKKCQGVIQTTVKEKKTKK